MVIPRAWLEGLADLTRREGLWLLSDEVYENYAWGGEHVSVGQFAPERTFTAFSFSKAYGMAGNRVGYLVGPKESISQCRKISTHTFYSAPTAGQIAAAVALERGDGWLESAHDLYKEAGLAMAKTLNQKAPEGSTFLFLNVSHKLDERGIFGFLEDCLDDGLILAPGPSFGPSYSSWVRVCYTCAAPDQVEEAAKLLAKRI